MPKSVRVQRHSNPHTLGLRVDSPEQIGYDQHGAGLAPVEIYRFKNYVGAFYNYVIENLNRAALETDDWQRTISISTGGVGPRIRKLSLAEKDSLMKNGQVAVNLFLQKQSNGK